MHLHTCRGRQLEAAIIASMPPTAASWTALDSQLLTKAWHHTRHDVCQLLVPTDSTSMRCAGKCPSKSIHSFACSARPATCQ